MSRREPLYFLGMVERQAIGDAPSPVVPDDRKTLEAEMPHNGNLVTRHGPFRIGLVIRGRRWLGASAVTTQVGRHDSEVFRQPRRHPVPDDMRLRIAVEEQQRRTGAADAQTDCRFADVKMMKFKASKHWTLSELEAEAQRLTKPSCA